jgi:asparagine synthase (glutamine-hydrolysing)
MCGIFGWVAAKGRARDESELRRLTDLLSHRGPDGSGFLSVESADGQHKIAFGHRRLSIIDIEGGAQPMRSADGNVVLNYN